MTKLPLLIVPGIMSSGLEVRKSGVDDKHVGERVWLNVTALGMGALYSGPVTEKKKAREEKHEKNRKMVQEKKMEEASDTEEEDEAEEMAEREKSPELYKCKSAWLQHLSLQSDMCTEREGNEIRPIKGLDGVDFLTELATIDVGASYVFAPVIKLLEGAGYTRGVNFDAVPYDWRVPPSVLEERDGYFTETMDRIEKLYADNDNTPVVLLCHSMGTKTGHYLLNFAEKRRGREWIDKHIHTYMPLGGPHIGAPSLIGQTFSGGLNPMLDPLLTIEERLIFARSLGSGAWLMPTTLPANVAALPTIICRNEGALHITIVSIGDCDKLVRNQYGTREVEPFRVSLKYGDQSAKSTVVQKEKSGAKDAQIFSVPNKTETYIFSTPPTLDCGLEKVQLVFQEPGNLRAYDKEPSNKLMEGLRLIDRDRGARLLVSAARKTAGTFKSVFGRTTEHAINTKELSEADDHEVEMTIPVVARVDMTLWGCEPKPGHRSINVKLRLKWIPPPSEGCGKDLGAIGELSKDKPFAPTPVVKSCTDSEAEYAAMNGNDLLKAEGIGGPLGRLVKERYGNDPMGPRTLSSSDAPPVSRVYAVYGINIDTWVTSVCRRSPNYVAREGRVSPKFVLDGATRIAGGSTDYKLTDGKIWETSNTPQKDLKTGKTIRCCGDGTVPYWSLQQSHLWQSPTCEVRVKEIEGGEHRAILNDKRFHEFLLGFLVEGK